MDCYCENVAYSPVCSVKTGSTFYSPCHAACNRWDSKKKMYLGCGCASESLDGDGNSSVIYRSITEENDGHRKADDDEENTMIPGTDGFNETFTEKFSL